LNHRHLSFPNRAPTWASKAVSVCSILAGAALLEAPHAHADAPQGRYVEEANGVRDTKTYLLWQKSASTSASSFTGAANYCAMRGTGWRVPTMKELLTLVDRGRYNPATDTRYFPDPAYEYWSSSSLARDTTQGWSIELGGGSSSPNPKNLQFRVRCVMDL
jgi:hypothetical protein